MSGTLPFMEPWEEYKAEPILEMLETGGFKLKLDLLDEMFDKVRNLPVAIISVAGPFRKGKSFMLNLLADYLLQNQSQNWYSNGKRQINSVFGFRGGTERDTVGIHLTKKPFMLKNKEEKEIAVFLMDTQGMFDNKTSTTDNSVIFALSTLLSSVQIYNLSELIQENDLQHLQVFTNYAKYVADQKRHVNSSTAPFQGLVFLLRNWEQMDYEHGFKGGSKYLSTVMEPQIEENRLVRQNLSNSFSDVVCSLIPRPGKKISMRKPNNTEVFFSNIDEDFIIEVDALVKYLFNKENLIVKRLNGWKLTGESIIDLAIEYTKILSSGKMPKVDTIVKSNEKADFSSKIRQFEEEYKMNMLKKMGETAVDPSLLKQMHEECLAIARKQFQEHDVLEDTEESKANLEQMESNIGIICIFLGCYNNAKMANITTLLDEIVNEAGRVYYEELEMIAGNQYIEDMAAAKRNALAEATAFFALATENLDKYWVNEKRPALKIEFNKQHKQFLKENETRKPSTEHTMSILFTKSVKKYQELMEQAIEQRSENVKYEHVHRKALEHALQFFDSSPIGADTAYKTAKRECLEDELLKQLGNYQEQFETDYQAIVEWRAMAKDCYKSIFQDVQMKYVGDQHLHGLHVKALERAKESFSKHETKLTDHFNQHMKALEEDMELLFEKIKRTNFENMKAIQKKLHPFYPKLEADYLEKLYEVIRKRYANINTVNARHENFKEAIKIEVEKIVPSGNLRQEIIQRCVERLDAKYKDAKTETANFGKGMLGMPGHVIGLGFKTVVGAFIGLGKAPKTKLDLSLIPSVKYLRSLGLAVEYTNTPSREELRKFDVDSTGNTDLGSVENPKTPSSEELPQLEEVSTVKIDPIKIAYQRLMEKKMVNGAVDPLCLEILHDEYLAVAKEQLQMYNVDMKEGGEASMKQMEIEIGSMYTEFSAKNNAKICDIMKCISEAIANAGIEYYNELERISEGKHIDDMTRAKEVALQKANVAFGNSTHEFTKHWVDKKRSDLQNEFVKQQVKFEKTNATRCCISTGF